MLAEILTIGDELCRGEIVDTNSSWMAGELWEMGVTVGWMTSCRDVADDVVRAVRDATERAEVVLVSGGLGPTEDDLTVDAIALVAGTSVTTDEASLERMKARFARASFAMTPNNLRQVRVPAGARVLPNPAGIAPGFEIAIGRATLFVMPGVPRELKAIWAGSVAPRLAGMARGRERIARRIYRVFGMGESHIGHRLEGLAAAVPGASVHYQVAFPETLVKLVVRDPDGARAEERLAALDGELRRRLGDVVYGVGSDDSLAAALGRALAARGATLAVAESCTGGMLGALVTSVPGSSVWFLGGWITYANELKLRELGVPEAVLREHGAVSEACVTAMARAARARAGATWAAAISGIAGPTGGSADKPVGTVHVAVAGPGEILRHKRYVFPGSRDEVRRLASYWAMAMVLRELKVS